VLIVYAFREGFSFSSSLYFISSPSFERVLPEYQNAFPFAGYAICCLIRIV